MRPVKLRRRLPPGCSIVDIRRGLPKSRYGSAREPLYAKLVAPDGEVLISGTLDYIYDAVSSAEVG